MKIIFFSLTFLTLFGCKDSQTRNTNGTQETKENQHSVLIIDKPSDIEIPEGTVWIPGGEFTQGAVKGDEMAMGHEKPGHDVAVDGFFMDKTEVTNAEFREFVDATGYITLAEREIEWEEMKKQLPAGTPKPHDSILQPGSLVFKKTKSSVSNIYDYSQWWEWKIGANWKHPQLG